MSTSNEEIVRNFLPCGLPRSRRRWRVFAEDGVYDNVPNKQQMVGPEAIGKWLAQCFEHQTRIDVEILHIAENGEWILSERFDDHIKGDRHMPLPVMNVSRIVDGKIKMFRDYYCKETVTELVIA